MSAAVFDPLDAPLEAITLIEASAGTGKTHTLATLYLRLLVEQELEVGQILVVTYTNAATAELRDRLRRRVRKALRAAQSGDAGSEPELAAWLAKRAEAGADRGHDALLLGRALRDFDEAPIFTIHGFCQRVLQENAFESGVSFDAQLVADETLLREDVVRDFWASRMSAAAPVLLRRLDSLRVTLGSLGKLAAAVTAEPDLEILPPVSSPADLDRTIAAWREARAHAARIWHARRSEVMGKLSTIGGNRYQARWLPGWAATMDGVFAVERADLVTSLAKFTSAGVREGAGRKASPPSDEFFPACDALAALDAALVAAFDQVALALRVELARHAPEEMRRRKIAADRQSFDDLLRRLDGALEGERGGELAAQIRDRHRAVLIDEFQDTDPVQYRIFRRLHLAGVAPLLLIGDPKQAIYSFRGADVHTYLHARRDAAGRPQTLDTNWRSDPTLIAAVNAVFAGVRAPFLLPEIPFHPVRPAPLAKDRLGGTAAGRPPFEILLVPGENLRKGEITRRIAAAVAGEIARFLGSGATLDDLTVAPGDVAVLCRTNQQARDTQRELRRLRVPSVLHGDSSVLDSDEAVEVERVLAAMADPGDARVLRAALATTIVGQDAEDLLRLQDDERRWDETLRQFGELREIWIGQGFVPAFRRLLDQIGVPGRLLALVDGERRLTNVLHLGELLQGAAAEARRGPLALVEWLHRMRFDRELRGELAAEAMQIRLESDERAVQLTTIHQSKGLEYPIVYCPFLWGGAWTIAESDPVRFHEQGDPPRVKLDLGSSERNEHVKEAHQEELAENLRLLYVALTRARNRCSVVWGDFADGNSSALGYVLHRGSDLPLDASFETVTAAIKARLSAGAMREDLNRLVAAARGAIAVADLSLEAGPIHHGERYAVAELAARRAERQLADRFRISSFSRLAASGGAISQPAEEGVDHDEDAAAPDAGAAAASDARAGVRLAEFPRGARAGELVHEILEHLDFPVATGQALAAEVSARLAAHGFEARWQEPLGAAIEDLLDAPLQEALTLRSIPRERRLAEMEFLFPVAWAAARGGGALGRDRLAAVLERHGVPAALPGYAERVRRLGFQPLAGYLRGFIDLVFEHRGRWFVADYKSNHLGPMPGDYRRPRLVAAMAHHHYFLQYLLYTVAVHRFLAGRLPGYDYDRHFGGVFYLFVRGTSPQRPECGVFHDRPDRAFVEELSAVLDRPDEHRGSGARR